jgi:hypothetical protein
MTSSIGRPPSWQPAHTILSRESYHPKIKDNPLANPFSLVIGIGTGNRWQNCILKIDHNVNMMTWIQCTPCTPHAHQHNPLFNPDSSPTFHLLLGQAPCVDCLTLNHYCKSVLSTSLAQGYCQSTATSLKIISLQRRLDFRKWYIAVPTRPIILIVRIYMLVSFP